MTSANLKAISESGVSIWLDDLSRDRLQTGSLAKLIEESCVVGVTTNPSIFSAAISGSTLYREDILALKEEGLTTSAIVTELTTSDVRNACDLFLPTFLESNQQDGRVSIEVDPRLAYNTSETISQGKQLHSLVNRPNLLIKVPATLDGLPAIEELTAQGISVNVTLIFSKPRYEAVMDSYLRGIERRLSNGLPVSDIHSVASFFVSRIDADIDKKLDAIEENHPLRGKAAIANAVLAYEAFMKVSQSARWLKLAERGANMQRPLWASTGVKDKSYDSTRYVVELVAAHCVNTMPESTLNEVRLHGAAHGDSITPAISRSHKVFADLLNVGIDFTAVVNFLEDDGVVKFEKAWEELLANVEAVS